MTASHHPASIHLWSGDFASQQLAFAHLLDTADLLDTAIDLDAVEVIPAGEAPRRLTPYFQGPCPDITGPVLILLPTPRGMAAPFTDTSHLAYLGAYPGRVLRAGGTWA